MMRTLLALFNNQVVFQRFNTLDAAGYLFEPPIPDIPGNAHMLILSDGLGHRYMSETRTAVCPILVSVFIL